jgi:hypothetical protein
MYPGHLARLCRMKTVRARVKAAPGGASLVNLNRRLRRRFLRVDDSAEFWELTYAKGGTSGPGSYGASARYKADFLNELIEARGIRSAIEFGCGDGNQLSLVAYPSYIGFDVSPTAIRRCISRFGNDGTKSFFLYRSDCFVDSTGLFTADLGVSLEVIFHLLEDEVYEGYMRDLFGCAESYVVIFGSDADELGEDPSVRHRPVVRWVEQHAARWRLVDRISCDWDPESFSSFFVFQRS